ncbi:kinase-like domain-containing protein [Nemania sp. FL0031]|nr:kinase-like domain-containing protein [Nemania sp. FL0031]
MAARLTNYLCRRLCQNCDAEYFLPSHELDAALTKTAIQDALDGKLQCNDEGLERILAQVMNSTGQGYRNIFAILVIIGKVKYIQAFIDANIRDLDLPLDYEDLGGRLNGVRVQHLHTFCVQQWAVIVPVLNFEPENLSATYSHSQRLPFLEKELVGKSGFAVMSKVRIHSSHVRGHGSQDSHFAVKEFSVRSHWQDELNALQRFRTPNLGHEHLIKLLFAFEHEGRGFFLVFPFAEGNLEQYWKSKSPTYEDAYWLIRQCWGLATALGKVHRHDSWHGDDRGRHGDIKPENILWFKESGTHRGHLVIADFGLTRFHSSDTVENTIPGQRGFSYSYRPPEVHFQLKTKSSQKFDIWSLGCLFLEFVSWYLIGYPAIRNIGTFLDRDGKEHQSFINARIEDDDYRPTRISEDKFFNGNNQEMSSIRVKESVIAWLGFLHRLENCSPATHGILRLIENSMLRVEPAERFTMAQVTTNLTEILHKCSDWRYCTLGMPQIGDRDYVYPSVLGGNSSQSHGPPTLIAGRDHEVVQIMMDNSILRKRAMKRKKKACYKRKYLRRKY